MLFWVCYWIQFTFNVLISNAVFGKNVVIFGAANSSPMHFDNIYEDNLILGEVSTRKLDDTTIIAEVK